MRAVRIPEGTWRPGPGRLFHFGTYRVPEDMSEALAQRAIDEGVAVAVVDEPPVTVRQSKQRTP